MSESDKTEKTEQPAANTGPLPQAKPDKNPKQPTHIRLINLAIIGFLIYGGLNYFSGGSTLPDSSSLSTTAEGGNIHTAALKASLHSDDPRIDRLLTQEGLNGLTHMFPKIRVGIGTKIVKQGEGRNLFCGQTAHYRLHASAADLSRPGKKNQLTLGQNFTHQGLGLTWGMEGMRAGEIREIRVPHDFNASPFTNREIPGTSYVVELLEVTPELPKAGEMPLRRFMQAGEAGYNLRCGDQAVAHMTLWSGEGKLLFSTLGEAPIYFEIGSGTSIPYGIELAAREMGPGGAYSLIIPAPLVSPLHPAKPGITPPKELDARIFPSDLVFPQGQIIIADLQFVKELPVKSEFKPQFPAPENPANSR